MPTFQHGKNAFLALGYDIGTTASTLSSTLSGTSASITLGSGTILNTEEPIVAGGSVYGLFINGVPNYSASAPSTTTTLGVSASAPSGSVVLPMINISPYINDIGFPQDVEPQETTTFNAAGVKSYIVGLKGYSLTFSGMYDPSAYGGSDGASGGIDQIMNDLYAFQNTGAFIQFCYGPATPGAFAGVTPSIKYFGQGISTKYDLKSSVNGVITFDGEIQVTGIVTRTTL